MGEKIKVLYDISVLGEILFGKKSRTGTFRVNEELLYALDATRQCDLLYCANNDSLYWYFASEYLRHNPRFNSSVGLCGNKWLRTASNITDLLFKTGNTDALGHWIKFLNVIEGNMVDPRALNGSEIFQAGFYHPLASQIKMARHLKKFLIVYDLIPIFYPHYSTPEWTALLMYTLEEAHKDSYFLCISHCTKKDLCNYLPDLDPDRIFVMHLGASDEFYPCHDQTRNKEVLQKYGIFDKPYIMSVGTFDIRKNFVHLIRCFKGLVRQERLADLCLVLIGREWRDYDNIIKEIEGDLKERIIITGFVNDDELAPLYSGALAFVTPSLYEGFSLPTLEAMQCGVPVITSNTSVFPEVVGDAGIMIDPTDNDALSQSILNIYKDGALRRSMSQKSIERSKMFSWTKSAQELVGAYRTVLRK